MSLITILIITYFISNAFITGYYVGAEMKFFKSKVLGFVFYFLFGSAIYIFVPLFAIWEFFSKYIIPELKFYYRFYFTSYFFDIVNNKNGRGKGKSKEDWLKEWNRLSNSHTGWTKHKLKRHVSLLNKKFNYKPQLRHQE